LTLFDVINAVNTYYQYFLGEVLV